ncbi:tRNA wybutosine-synthesizing protein 2 homolog [Liolophura sinensis]|uniref:tRNA wybutosine-synthesizing protein 2 homolog n=1 Tax=Liolophura sinensis TaxID=3198878 RepID=UPI003158105A
MTELSGTSAVLVWKKDAQLFRKSLEASGVWDGSRRLKCVGPNQVAIPVLDGATAKKLLEDRWPQRNECMGIEVISLDLPASKTSLLKQPHGILVENIRTLMEKSNIVLTPDMLKTIPKHWQIHGDLILLPSGAFPESKWPDTGSQLWNIVAKALGCQRVARKHAIASDGFRSPQVDLLLGDSAWVEHIDNGIKYSYDMTQCMFSCGNVTEKMRVAQFDCRGETVVDLYAGIGYFTLPFLVHAHAQMVHACEWNPAAAESLRRNLALNGVTEKCVVHEGDNRKICPKGIADRVNLGLIPSSEPGWPVACAALKPEGGLLHIHGNVTTIEPSTAILQGERNSANASGIYDSSESESESNLTEHNCERELNVLSSLGNDRGLAENRPNLHNFSPRTGDSCDTGDGLSPFVSTSGADAQDDMSPAEAIRVCSKSEHWNEEDYVRTDGTSRQLLKTACKAAFPYWLKWAEQSRPVIEEIFYTIYKKSWRTEIHHIEHVKSYAPHVDHIVVDLLCRPK